jgi:hypothetical protein
VRRVGVLGVADFAFRLGTLLVCALRSCLLLTTLGGIFWICALKHT